MQLARALFLLLVLLPLVAPAGVLPEERADALYHSYDGGGVSIDGPSILVRKNFAEKFSVSANYYLDMVSGASIDVEATASPYSDERTQTSLGIDYLRGDATLSLNYTNSDESDYDAETINFNIAHDVFGGLTTITMGYAVGSDEVRRNIKNPDGSKINDPGFAEGVDRQNYQLGVSQIISKNLIMGLAFETITDEGFLNNPYRTVRFLNPDGVTTGSEPERYPRTRTSSALGLTAKYYLPYRAAVSGLYRYFTDDWDIEAHTLELGYTHPKGPWIFDLKYRFYKQSSADFYSDLFPRANAQNFLARDKELSDYTDHTIGFGVSYEFLKDWKFISKGTVNFNYDHIMFDYDNFRDVRVSMADPGVTPGTEPLYSFDADIIQLYVSFWF